MKHQILTLALALSTLTTFAATTRNWDGSASGNWSNGANWVGGVAPAPGDSLVFPVSATRYITTNDFAAGRVFGGITIFGSNYFFRGADILLQDDLRALAESGPVTFDLGLTVDSPNAQTQFESRYGSVLRFNDTIHIVDADFPLQFLKGVIRVAGAITGPGRVEAINGDLYFDGSAANTFGGHLELSIGNLYLNKTTVNTAIPSGCIVERGGSPGWVRWLRDEQVPNNVQFDDLFLDLNGQTETVSDFFTSNVLTNGTLSINRDIVGSSVYLTGDGNGRIYLNPGNHQIISSNGLSSLRNELTGPGNVVKTGVGGMFMENSNSFTGMLIVSNGIVYIMDSHALGSTNAGTFVYPYATLMLRSSVRIEGEPLSLQGSGFFDPDAVEWLPLGYGALHAISPTNAWNGPITINGYVSVSAQEQGNAAVQTNAHLLLGGVISGAGTLVKEGQGVVVLTGSSANTHTGITWVREGTLRLDKNGATAIPDDLFIGDADSELSAQVDFARSTQIADTATVTITTGGLLNMKNQSDVIQNLTLQDGSLNTGNGTLVLSGNLYAVDLPYGVPYSSIDGAGRLQFTTGQHEILTENPNGSEYSLSITADIVGTGSLLKTGAGGLSLSGSNSFTGTFTAVEGLVRALFTPYAFGSTGAGTIISNTARLELYLTTIVGEPLTLAQGGTLYTITGATWDGPVVLPVDGQHGVVAGGGFNVGTALNLRGVISGPGDLQVAGGYVLFSGNQDNTQAGDLNVLQGTLLLTKTNAAAIASRIYIGNAATPELETVRHLRPNQLADDAGVYLYGTGIWDLDGFSETVGQFGGTTNSEVHLGAATLTVDKSNVGFYGFWGVISGTGGFTKRGTGDSLLAGDNTYTGPTLVQEGELSIDGVQPQSHVTVLPGARFSGFGTVGHVNAIAGSEVRPGYFYYEPALTTSNLTLQAGAAMVVKLYGPGSNQFVRVRGAVTLNAALLHLDWEYLPSPGDTFRLIDNDGADAVNGLFANYPPGQFTDLNGMLVEMIYGNDVTLRVLSPGQTNLPPGIGLTVTGGNGNGVIDPNECNHLRITVVNNSTNVLPPFQTMLLCDASEVFVTQPSSAYPSIPAQGSAQNVTPFQISTTSKLACGTNIPCRLLIYTTNGSGYALNLGLPTGSPTVPVTYTAAPNAPVLDGILTESTIPVAPLAGHLARVEVSLFIEHTLSSDLTLKLVAPDGTEVLLAEDLGNGMNYGTNCTARTIFADDASAAIGSASAPFVGTYRPANWLSVLRGMPGAAVAGNWKLRVNDHVHFNTGVLRCWSLTLAPAACTDGGGECETCPGAIVDLVGNGAPLANAHINAYNGEASNCFSNKPPGNVVPGSFPYRAHTFTNLSAQPTCVSVRFTPTCDVDPINQLGAAAYLGAFDPLNVSANFLGNPAVSLGGGVPRTFSFQVPGSNVFQIVVTAINNPACTTYSLEVQSPDLCPVRLNISALNANTMRLDWPTYAAGYELQRSPAVVPSNWNNVSGQPVVTGSRFVVTNDVVDPNGFYRLRKP